jgi:hypothetical protein
LLQVRKGTFIQREIGYGQEKKRGKQIHENEEKWSDKRINRDKEISKASERDEIHSRRKSRRGHEGCCLSHSFER